MCGVVGVAVVVGTGAGVGAGRFLISVPITSITCLGVILGACWVGVPASCAVPVVAWVVWAIAAPPDSVASASTDPATIRNIARFPAMTTA